MAAFAQAQQGRIATSSRAAARPARYVSAHTTSISSCALAAAAADLSVLVVSSGSTFVLRGGLMFAIK